MGRACPAQAEGRIGRHKKQLELRDRSWSMSSGAVGWGCGWLAQVSESVLSLSLPPDAMPCGAGCHNRAATRACASCSSTSTRRGCWATMTAT